MLAVKSCRECGLTLPLSDFYRHKMMGDGHLNKCKECVRLRVLRHREENIESVREYDRLRGSLPHRVKAREMYAKTIPKELLREYHLRTIRKNPERRQAHIIVGNAIRDGILVKQSCFVCRNPKSQAHHPDYAKPLEVVWLCTKCHAELHRAERAIRRAELLRHAPKEDTDAHAG